MASKIKGRGKRIKAGLARRKAEGLPVGNGAGADLSRAAAASIAVRQNAARDFMDLTCPVVILLRSKQKTLRESARIMNECDMVTRRGKPWTPEGVRRVLQYLERRRKELDAE